MPLGRCAFETKCLERKVTQIILVAAQNGPGAMMSGKRSQRAGTSLYRRMRGGLLSLGSPLMSRWCRRAHPVCGVIHIDQVAQLTVEIDECALRIGRSGVPED